MEIKDMGLEEIEARKAEIRSLLDSDDCDIDALKAEVDQLEEREAALKAEIETRKAIAAKVVAGDGEVREKFEEERKMGEKIEVRNTKEYIDAYADYIKTGKPDECRALISENGTNGTVPVPEFVYDIVKTAWDREGIMSRVRKAYLRGNLKVGFEISATGAVVHAEGAQAPSEETLTLGVVTLVPTSIKKWVTITDEIADLRGEAFLRYIYDELAYQIAKAAADYMVEAILDLNSTGSATAPVVGELDLNGAGISVSTIASALGLLSDEAANPVIIMNRATWSAFKAVQYAASYPIDPFEGLPVVFNNNLPAYADATDGDVIAIVGDLGQGALANFPNGEGIDFKYDDLTLAEADLVKIVGRQYVAMGVVAPNSFVKVGF